MRKTDNSNLAAKLDLRRYFLSKYPANSVLDCCQGDGAIWNVLRKEFNPRYYLPIDIKPKKGRLQVESSRVLEAGDWNFDCIDVDTYGEPWKHWQQIINHGHGQITVFLTIGLVKVMGGSISTLLASWCGLAPLKEVIPKSMQVKCAEISLPYALARADKNDFSIIEALEAPRAKNARYVGVRLEKKGCR